MGNRSRNTGNREERSLAAQLPGAKKISRSGYTGPDIEWRGRHIEAKYRRSTATSPGCALPNAKALAAMATSLWIEVRRRFYGHYDFTNPEPPPTGTYRPLRVNLDRNISAI